MPKPIMTTGAMMTCSFGVAPSTLNVLPVARTTSGEMPVATIADAAPMVNIPPFGMCTTLSNPTVAAATAAALGVLTPMPCVPVTAAWIPQQPLVLVAGKPVLVAGSQCMCAWGGAITVMPAGPPKALA
jgi:hypothetical protein